MKAWGLGSELAQCHFCCIRLVRTSYEISVVSVSKEIAFTFFVWWDWGLNPGLYTGKTGALLLTHPSSSFCSGYFGDGVSWNICLSLPWTAVLLIPSSQVARFTGMSHHWCLARLYSLMDVPTLPAVMVWMWSVLQKAHILKTWSLTGGSNQSGDWVKRTLTSSKD
jgi:hypothetical protein